MPRQKHFRMLESPRENCISRTVKREEERKKGRAVSEGRGGGGRGGGGGRNETG